jgi:hypothetical protein
MPEITTRGKLFFSTKIIGGWSVTDAAIRCARDDATPFQ